MKKFNSKLSVVLLVLGLLISTDSTAIKLNGQEIDFKGKKQITIGFMPEVRPGTALAICIDGENLTAGSIGIGMQNPDQKLAQLNQALQGQIGMMMGSDLTMKTMVTDINGRGMKSGNSINIHSQVINANPGLLDAGVAINLIANKFNLGMCIVKVGKEGEINFIAPEGGSSYLAAIHWVPQEGTDERGYSIAFQGNIDFQHLKAKNFVAMKAKKVYFTLINPNPTPIDPSAIRINGDEIDFEGKDCTALTYEPDEDSGSTIAFSLVGNDINVGSLDLFRNPDPEILRVVQGLESVNDEPADGSQIAAKSISVSHKIVKADQEIVMCAKEKLEMEYALLDGSEDVSLLAREFDLSMCIVKLGEEGTVHFVVPEQHRKWLAEIIVTPKEDDDKRGFSLMLQGKLDFEKLTADKFMAHYAKEVTFVVLNPKFAKAVKPTVAATASTSVAPAAPAESTAPASPAIPPAPAAAPAAPAVSK